MVISESLQLTTDGRDAYEITDAVQAAVGRTEVTDGLCTVFVHHTSASLMVCENADPTVISDLERFMHRLVPDGDRIFRHTAEGPDDMPAHVRSVLTQASLSIPIRNGRCDLGMWQGVFLFEHRTRPHRRCVTVTVVGQQ